MTQYQQKMLQIAKDFKRICDTHNLRYSLYGGTLIGAVRHKGFIPWDDDMDFCMPRPDYDRLIELEREYRQKGQALFSGNYRLCHIALDSHTRTHGNIEDLNTTIMIDLQKDNHNNNTAVIRGVFIDIMPLDGYGNDYIEAEKLQNKIRKFCRKLSWNTLLTEHNNMYKKPRIATGKNRFFKYIKQKRYNLKHKLYLLLTKRAFIKKRLKTISKSRENIINLIHKYDYENSRFVGADILSPGYPKIMFLKHFVEPFSITFKFEDTEFRCMNNYEYYLRLVFDDYMIIPPPDKRVTHGFDYVNLDLPYEEFEREYRKNNPDKNVIR